MRLLRGLGTCVLAAALGLFLCVGPLTGISYAVDTFYPAFPFLSVDYTTAGIIYFTGSLWQFGTTTTVPAHISSAQTTAPALTGCITGGSPTLVGTDTSGVVTSGTTASTTCTVTFNVAYSTAPTCLLSFMTQLPAAMTYTVSTTAIVTTNTSTASMKFAYACVGVAGG
jgi:hypothetical protein